MHQFELKSYLKRSLEFGKECLIKTEADHPAIANHLPVRTQLGGGETTKWRLDPSSSCPRTVQLSLHSRTSACLPCLVGAAQLCTVN